MARDFDHSLMENWVSHPRGMMKYYRSMKYELGQSIADLIDNCFDGGATKIDVRVDYADEEQMQGLYIRILDNGKGMNENQLSKAMILGAERDRKVEHELGVFGIGMKLSALAQANQVTIVSQQSGKYCTRRIDATYIIEKNENHIFKHPTGLKPYKLSQHEMIEGDWSTMILLEDIHNKKWRTWDKNEDISLENELTKIKIHLRLTYHRILRDFPNIELNFQGKKIEPLDPTMPWETDPNYGTVTNTSTIKMEIGENTVIVKITMVIIPHSKQFRVDKKKCTSVHKGYKKANDMQGLYLYRNDRLIDYGGWQRLLGETNDEHDKCGKILIDIPAKYHEEFGLNPTKTEVNLPEEFMRKLAKAVEVQTRWGNIKNGNKNLTFKQAVSYRYANEGQRAINRDKKKALQKKQRLTGIGGAETESTQPEVPAAPGSRSKKRTTAHEPKPVVTSINESNPNWTIVQLDKQKDGYQRLIELLRMWEE